MKNTSSLDGFEIYLVTFMLGEKLHRVAVKLQKALYSNRERSREFKSIQTL